MVNKIPSDQMGLAEAKAICTVNGIKWLDLHSAYFKATGRTMYTTYTKTRISRAMFANALTAWHIEKGGYPNMTTHTAQILDGAARRTYHAMLNISPEEAERFKAAIGISDEPYNDPHPVVVACRFMDWMRAAR